MSIASLLNLTTLLFCLLSGAPALAGEARLTVTPSSTEITMDENVSVEFKIESAGGAGGASNPTYQAPDFDEVNVYSSNQMSTTIVNGQITMTTARGYTVVFNPKHEGRLVIRNIQASVDGKVLRAPDLAIDVRPAGARTGQRGGNQGLGYPQSGKLPPGTAHAPPAGNGQGFFIKAEPSKLRAYKGEQIILTYALYTRVPLMNIQVERYPNPNGFLKEDIDIPLLRGRLDYSPSVVGGREYRRAVLAQYAIFPLKEGTLPIDTFTAKISYQPGQPGMNMDDDPFAMLHNFFRAMQTTSETKTSDRVSIEVLPLPGSGQPANFSGLVGDFDIATTVDRTSVKSGEPINVKVKVAGKGHAGMLEHLNVSWPQDFELYEDKSNTQYLRSGESERLFEYMVIPKVKGRFEIPAIELSMFNPDTQAYQTRKSQAIGIEVLEGSGSNVYVPKTGGGSPAPVTEDIRYWKDSLPESQGTLLQGVARAVAMASLVVAALSLWSLGTSTEAERRQTRSRMVQALSEKIRGLKAESASPVETLGEVESLLAQLLELQYGVAIGSLTRAEVARTLVDRRIEESIAKKVESLMELVENQRYAPGGGDRPGASRAVEELGRLAERII